MSSGIASKIPPVPFFELKGFLQEFQQEIVSILLPWSVSEISPNISLKIAQRSLREIFTRVPPIIPSEMPSNIPAETPKRFFPKFCFRSFINISWNSFRVSGRNSSDSPPGFISKVFHEIAQKITAGILERIPGKKYLKKFLEDCLKEFL